MADYYVMYQGTKYEVEDYSAGIAKAKELGSEAVFYVDAQLPDSMHTFCAGVNVVFSGGYAAGTASKRYIFGGLSGSGEVVIYNDIDEDVAEKFRNALTAMSV